MIHRIQITRNQNTHIVPTVAVFRTTDEYTIWRNDAMTISRYETPLLARPGDNFTISLYLNVPEQGIYAVRHYTTPQQHPDGYEYVTWAVHEEHFISYK